MGLIGATSGVFSFLRDLYGFLPVAVRLLILTSFGGVVLIAVMRSIGR